MIRNISALAISSLLLACSTPITKQTAIDQQVSESEKAIQHELAFQNQAKRHLRAMRVALPILRTSAPHCGNNTAPHLGFLAYYQSQFQGDVQRAAVKHWNLTDDYKVVEIFAGSPAENAGLQKGDVIVRINNQAVSSKQPDIRTLIAAPHTPGREIAVDILRAGEARTLQIPMDVVCNYPVTVVTADDVNAYADGKGIYITSGMLRFTENDDELATVIGHEFAHNQMDHMGKKSNNQLLGVILGAVATAVTGVDVTNLGGNLGAGAFSQDFEAEADYVGIYATARAGYDIRSTPNFWRRMGAEHPKAISHGASHPNTANRYLALDKAVKEIDEKQLLGQALVPNLK